MSKKIRNTFTAEHKRLLEDSLREKNWKRWGPYLSERQWGTVREDYSEDQESWHYFTHEQSRSRAYRWGEDGLLGITDRQCRLCFGLALWNGKDPILKERLFGLAGPEGNHGEDVKEYYYYLDSTPTHSYMKALYKYPQKAFPYDQLVHENRHRGRDLPEFELLDTGIFDENRYFDVTVEYAKAGPEDILIQITVDNRGPDTAHLDLLPTLWLRNTWSWLPPGPRPPKPGIWLQAGELRAHMHELGSYFMTAGPGPGRKLPRWLFTENETNEAKLFGKPAGRRPVKDAFHEFLINGNTEAINPRPSGTKAAAHYHLKLKAGGSATVRLRLTSEHEMNGKKRLGQTFGRMMTRRRLEADKFSATVIPQDLDAEQQELMRQAHAGLLWSKQFYEYNVEEWIKGDAKNPTYPSRLVGRNSDWPHLMNRDVISMPDKWEYPWYAAWDLAFHMIPFTRLDPQFVKDQLLLFLREWYMHPNGQLPAYEWALGDVNPPVHAWACWRFYKMTSNGETGGDRLFLARAFQKMLLNFTWWVNRKDVRGKNVFSGGFLGLDNIGIFDRSKPLPTGGHLEQADGTAWVAYFCSSMLSMALELAAKNPVYEDMASKFFEHYLRVAEAMNTLEGSGLWDEEDGFYYDHLYHEGTSIPMKIRSMVGIIPLFTVDVLYDDVIRKLPGFRKRMDWFLNNRNLTEHMSCMQREIGGGTGMRLLAIPSEKRLLRVLKYVLDENEFLSPYGIRSLSKIHESQPFVFDSGGEQHVVSYIPGESDSGMFGGNSNWRGPIWFPMNYLLVEAFRRYHQFYGETLKVECPTGSGQMMTFKEVAEEIEGRLLKLFLKQEDGHRPHHGGESRYATDKHWNDLFLFYEYFDAETGRGLGASHQTGWTALIATLLARGKDTTDTPATMTHP